MIPKINRIVKPSIAPSDGLVSAAKVVIATLCGWIVLSTLLWEFQHHFPTPYYDDLFDKLRFYRSPRNFGALLNYFIIPHNEHRIATTRIFAVLDERLFSGREYTQVVISNGLQLVLAVVCYKFGFEAWIGKAWTTSDRLLAFGAIILFFINPDYLYTLIVPFQLQHVIMAALAVSVACLMMRASVEPQAGPGFGRLLAALIGLAFVGTFTLGNSPMLLIAATATAVALRWPVRRIAILGACTLIHLAIVLKTTPATGHLVHPLGDTIRCFLAYLGAPFLRYEIWPSGAASWPWSSTLAEALGLLVLVTGVGYGAARLLRPGLGGPVSVFGLTLLAAVIVTAAAAAYSRAQFGPFEGASKKYASFAVLGWLGALAVVTGIWSESTVARRLSNMAPISLAALVMLLFSVNAWQNEFRIWRGWINNVQEASTAVFTKANVKFAVQSIYTDPDELNVYVGYVEGPRRGVFSRFPFRYGDNVDAFLASRREVGCRSEVETLDPIKGDDLSSGFKVSGSPVSMSGWTWMADTRTPPETVIAVDAQRRIVGVAKVTRKSAQIERWMGQSFDGEWGWYGYGRIQDGAPVNEFIAIGSGAHTFCRLGGVGNVTQTSDMPRPGMIRRLVWRFWPAGGAAKTVAASTSSPTAASKPLATFASVPPKPGAPQVGSCLGNIDEINGKPPTRGESMVSAFNIRGWLALDAGKNGRPDAVFVTLRKADGALLFAAAEPAERNDVSDHYHQPALKMSGYAIYATLPPKGDYLLGLAAVRGNDMILCKNMDIPINVRF